MAMSGQTPDPPATGEFVSPTPETPAEELEAAHGRIAELERKVGQQQLELDFFRQALRQAKGVGPTSGGPGVTASTQSSKR